MTEELLRQYAALRAKRLMLNGAQSWFFSEKVVQLWASGSQAEEAMKTAAKELGHATAA